MNKRWSLYIVSLLTIVTLSVLVVYIPQKQHAEEERQAQIAYEQKVAEWKTLSQLTFKNTPTQAKAIAIYNIERKELLYGQNENTPLPLASITKLMTALVSAMNLDRNEVVTVTDQALQEEGEYGLQKDERWSRGQLNDFTLINSSNDGAKALAIATEIKTGRRFEKSMNEEATLLQLKSMHFNNPTGLDIEEVHRAGGYGSALDAAKLEAYILDAYPDVLEKTSTAHTTITSLAGIPHFADNTNEAITQIPNIIASKTGFTTLAGGNLVFTIRINNERYVISILGSTKDARFSDAIALASSTRAVLQNQPKSL